MASHMEIIIQEAKEVEQTLKDEGRHHEAQCIMRLRRSAQTARSTLKTLHRDNMELRDKIDAKDQLPQF